MYGAELNRCTLQLLTHNYAATRTECSGPTDCHAVRYVSQAVQQKASKLAGSATLLLCFAACLDYGCTRHFEVGQDLKIGNWPPNPTRDDTLHFTDRDTLSRVTSYLSQLLALVFESQRPPPLPQRCARARSISITTVTTLSSC